MVILHRDNTTLYLDGVIAIIGVQGGLKKSGKNVGIKGGDVGEVFEKS